MDDGAGRGTSHITEEVRFREDKLLIPLITEGLPYNTYGTGQALKI